MAAKKNKLQLRNGKKNKKELGLIAATVLMLALLIAGLFYTRTEAYLARHSQATTTVQQPKKVVEGAESTEAAEMTAETTEAPSAPAPAPSTELVWEKQDAPVQLPILMYHAIHVMAPGEEANANLIVDPTTFESHLKALQEAGYYAVSPEEAYKILTENVLPQGKKVVWLTFDDSLWDFYDIAYPLLKQYQMQATNNVITGTVGQEANLSLDEMKEMKENGISLQGHTITHPALGNIDPAQQNTELAESKTYLDSNLNQDTISFAYPSGSYTEETIAIAEQNNYKMALTTNEGLASAADGLLSLNRVRVLPYMTAEILLQTIATP